MFTVNLKVDHWPCLVVGGGKIACPKARRLIEAGADVTVIAPVVKESLAGAFILEREVEAGDLDGKKLVILATDDRDLNRNLWHEARKRGILSMVVDDPDFADFYSPAILKRGDLEIAVSTAGKGPAFSARIRDIIADTVDDAYGSALEWFASFRRTHLAGRDMQTRIAVSRALLQENFIDYFRDGREEVWQARAQQILARISHQLS